MKRQLYMLFFITLICALLFGGTATAWAADATPTTSLVVLNGNTLPCAAYNIGGNNYFKLRDMTKALDVFTYYSMEFNAIYLDTSKSYVAEATAATAPLPPAAVVSGNGSGALSDNSITTKLVDGKDLAREDFSQQANPAIFDAVFTRGAYNAIRQSIVDRDKIIPGNNENGFNPNYHYAHAVFADTEDAYTALNSVLTRIGTYYRYLRKAEPYTQEYYKYPGYFICAPTSPAIFTEANAATEDILSQAQALPTDAEKIKLMNNYLCDKMTYETGASAGVADTFTSKYPVAGRCTSYAYNYQYLCDRAGIPCIVISGDNHAWNIVYADGQWLYVDVSQNDLTSSPATLLSATCNKMDETPKVTAFCKELLIPGSTL